MPWFFWALARLSASPGAGHAAIAAAIGGGFALGSHPQISYYALLAGAAFTAGWLAMARGGPRRRACAWLAPAALAAALVGAAQVVPAVELVRDASSGGPRGGDVDATSYALEALDLARMVAPNVAGNPFLNEPLFDAGDFFTWDTTTRRISASRRRGPRRCPPKFYESSRRFASSTLLIIRTWPSRLFATAAWRRSRWATTGRWSEPTTEGFCRRR
ncbi:MAG TPA: hypothetical protein VNH11_00045 [Pirellulales bacterium]|nr:hypothetical protein [Pirellulales bacterium]